METLPRFVRSTPFFVVAHRGASGDAPENTLASIAVALGAGARMIEIDVQFSADHQAMVFHDAVLGRTTDGHGQFRERTAEELRTLDAGSWFAPQFVNERIPLLDEVCAMVQNRAYLLLELKPLGEGFGTSEIEAVVTAVEQRDMLLHTAFASFDHRSIAYVKYLNKDIPTIALNVPGDLRNPSEVTATCGADAYGCSVRELAHSRCANAREHNIPVGVYTVNDAETLHHVRHYGVNAVLSNRPADIIQAL